jgi:hypothetical protein
MQEASTLALCEALLDFAAAPGRHALRLREPTVLFDELDLVALWALGRLPEGMAEPQAVRQAALLFVLRACFAPGLNHYQLLGLSPSFSAAQLRARYRALIRLTHPDMGIEGLPVGAAGMVNRAHAVLADEAQRALYDRQLYAQLPSAAAMPSATGLDAGRVGAAAPGASNLALAGSRWSLFRHVASMRVLRMVLTGGVLLLAALLALAWALRGTGNQGRLVAQERDVGAPKPGLAEPTETVRLRVPAQWSNGVEVPLANVQVPSSAVAPAAPVAKPKLAEPATATAASSSSSSSSSSATATASTVSPAPSFLTSLTSAFKASPAKPEEVVVALAPAAVKPASASTWVSAPTPALKTASSAAASAASATASAPSLSSASTPPAKAAPTAVQASATATSAATATAAKAKAAAAKASAAAQPAPGPRWPSAKADNTPSSFAAAIADVPVVAERGTVWDVDVPSARMYLQDLLNQLEQPEQARNTSHALTQMNVNGSLLMPPGVVGDAVRSVQIERADLSESHRPGFLRIRGVMKAQVISPNNKPRAVRWRVQAEFRGTAQGTVLTLLDLKEAE